MIPLCSQTAHRHALLPIQSFMFIYCHIGALYKILKENKWFYFISNCLKRSKKRKVLSEHPPQGTSNYASHGCGMMAEPFVLLMTLIKLLPTITGLFTETDRRASSFFPTGPTSITGLSWRREKLKQKLIGHSESD